MLGQSFSGRDLFPFELELWFNFDEASYIIISFDDYKAPGLIFSLTQKFGSGRAKQLIGCHAEGK